MQEAVDQAFVVQLGGAGSSSSSASGDWGCCLAVRVGEELSKLRSQLGNALAAESSTRGQRAMGLVAYVEVSGWAGRQAGTSKGTCCVTDWQADWLGTCSGALNGLHEQ